ncbi:peptidase family M13 [Necator americanus]|uniref:Peptidase family M13 n=1 Tax=Necator americanus TaxID=51031 RepID=W2SNF5_NECAM|nr:peptidase family M13 [Necator americanus]ETN70232.1 peptidase family M13 [Necator americanus]
MSYVFLRCNPEPKVTHHYAKFYFVQHILFYIFEHDSLPNFLDLLRELAQSLTPSVICFITRFRFCASSPSNDPDTLISTLCGSPKVCLHKLFCLSFFSGMIFSTRKTCSLKRHTKTTKKKGETERIDGFTQWKIQQRTRCFSWEFIWGEKLNDFELMLWIEIEEHAPSPLRVNNVVSNIEGFAEAFRCPPGTPMNPKERCSIF